MGKALRGARSGSRRSRLGWTYRSALQGRFVEGPGHRSHCRRAAKLRARNTGSSVHSPWVPLVLGFLLGVLSSVVAAPLIWWATRLLPRHLVVRGASLAIHPLLPFKLARPPVRHSQAVIDELFAAWAERDRDRYLACWHADAVKTQRRTGSDHERVGRGAIAMGFNESCSRYSVIQVPWWLIENAAIENEVAVVLCVAYEMALVRASDGISIVEEGHEQYRVIEDDGRWMIESNFDTSSFDQSIHKFGALARRPKGRGGSRIVNAPGDSGVVEDAYERYGASQVLVVRPGLQDGTGGILSAYERTADGWNRVIGPIDALLGENGVTRSKSEGDGRTPLGVFRIKEAFGFGEDPGTDLPYRRLHGDEVWVDDPDSSVYNTLQRAHPTGAWRSAERLSETPDAYEWAAVIEYNRAPTISGLGSAIFIHVSVGHPTTGCVAIGRSELREILRWLRPEQRLRSPSRKRSEHSALTPPHFAASQGQFPERDSSSPGVRSHVKTLSAAWSGGKTG
jgi:L,D-peptidoglycan transpeptidase YkuD (ErfK/YbiS/YcfS/YnhG family)